MNLLKTHPKLTVTTLACLLSVGSMTAGYWMRMPHVTELTLTLEAVTLRSEQTLGSFQEAQRELARASEQSNLLQTERNDLEQQLETAEARVADLAGCVVKDADGHTLTRVEIEAIRDGLDASRVEISKLDEQIRTASYEKTDLQHRIASLEQDADQLGNIVGTLLQDNERLTGLVQDKSEQVDRLVILKQELSTALTDSRESLAAAQPDVTRARRLSSQYAGATLESRRFTATGRKLAGAGNPVSGLLNLVGDAFVGTVEAVAGAQGEATYFLACEGLEPVNLGTDRARAVEQFRSLTGREP